MDSITRILFFALVSIRIEQLKVVDDGEHDEDEVEDVVENNIIVCNENMKRSHRWRRR